MALWGGVDNRIAGDRILSVGYWDDGASPPVPLTSGTATVAYRKIANDGTVTSFDFSDNTFKTTPGTGTASLTHQADGIWTRVQTALTAFAQGDVIVEILEHSTGGKLPPRMWVYGRAEADVRLWAGMKTSEDTTFGTAFPHVNVNSVGLHAINANSISPNAITVEKIADGAITAAKLATDSITAEKIAANAVAKIQSGLSTLDAAGVRSAVGLSSANLDDQLATIDANVDSILVDTGTDIPGTLTIIAGYLDTEIAAIKAKTDNLPASPAATGDIPSAAAIASQVRAELATELAEVSATNVVTDKLDTTLEQDGAVYRFTANALEQSPAAEGALTPEQNQRLIDIETGVNALGLADGLIRFSPVGDGGRITLYKGFAYTTATGTEIRITDSTGAALPAAGSAVTLTAVEEIDRDNGDTFTASGTVEADGNNLVAVIEIPSATLDDVGAGNYRYMIHHDGDALDVVGPLVVRRGK